MNTGKVIIFSTLISATMIMWYEIIGVKFLVAVAIFIMVIVLIPKKK